MRRTIAAITLAIAALGMPAAGAQPVNGIDASHYQGAVNWSAVPSSVTFVGTKATENCKTDSQFANNWQGARRTGRTFRLAYVFLHQGQDPAAVVKCLAAAIHKAGGPLEAGEGVALDVEASPTISVDYTLSVAVQVQVQLNRFPVIYAGCYYGHILTAKSLAGYAHWLAAYRSTAPCPYDLWQFSSTGRVPGVAGNVDVNAYNAVSAFGSLVRSTRDAIADPKSTVATLQPEDQQQVADLTAFYRAVALREFLQLGAANNLRQSASATNVRHALNGLGFSPAEPVAVALRFFQGVTGLPRTGTLTADTRNGLIFQLTIRSRR